MDEEWRAVVGFPDYEVSNLGRVRSLDHLKWSGPVGFTKVKGRILKCSIDGRGYLNVNLRRVGNRAITRCVHNIVIEAFLGPVPEGLICCHNDDDKTNPVLANLRYDTRASNNADTYKNGIRKAEDNSPRAKKAAETRYRLNIGICRRKPEYDV